MGANFGGSGRMMAKKEKIEQWLAEVGDTP